MFCKHICVVVACRLSSPSTGVLFVVSVGFWVQEAEKKAAAAAAEQQRELALLLKSAVVQPKVM